MENENTVYKDDKRKSFIEYVFSNKPQEKGVIKLECGLPDEVNHLTNICMNNYYKFLLKD